MNTHNKVKVTRKQDSFLRDNYKTMNSFQLSAGTGLSKRIIKRRMGELGLVRTEEEKKAVWTQRRMPDSKEISKRNQKIEGGGRGNMKTKYHLDKWNSKNGTFSNKHMLVYKNGKFDDYNDLKLIRKWRYDSFVEERTARLEKAGIRSIERSKKEALNEEKRKKREIIDQEKALKRAEKEKVEMAKREESNKKAAIAAKKAAIVKKKKEEADERQRVFDELKSKAKTLDETHTTLLKEEKVPVKLDHKTTIYVKKSLCEQLEDGTWRKKTTLNIVKQRSIPVVLSRKKKKHENNNENIPVSAQGGRPVEHHAEAVDGTASN